MRDPRPWDDDWFANLAMWALVVTIVGVAGVAAYAYFTEPAHGQPVTLSPLPVDPNPTTGVQNPAVTDANASTTICVPGWTKTVRPPASYTTGLKRQQLPPGTDLSGYEEDHVWPIEDGGNPRDPGNLRPQWWLGPDGARAKDHQVENVIHRAICKTHTMTIEQGHAVLAAWIVAHHPYPVLPPGAPH